MELPLRGRSNHSPTSLDFKTCLLRDWVTKSATGPHYASFGSTERTLAMKA